MEDKTQKEKIREKFEKEFKHFREQSDKVPPQWLAKYRF